MGFVVQWDIMGAEFFGDLAKHIESIFPTGNVSYSQFLQELGERPQFLAQPFTISAKRMFAPKYLIRQVVTIRQPKALFLSQPAYRNIFRFLIQKSINLCVDCLLPSGTFKQVFDDQARGWCN